jgi:hypothetical protein
MALKRATMGDRVKHSDARGHESRLKRARRRKAARAADRNPDAEANKIDPSILRPLTPGP